MPSLFIPMDILFAEVELSGDDMNSFQESLFSNLETGLVAAKCTEATYSTLNCVEYDDLDLAFEKEGLSLRIGNGLRLMLETADTVHARKTKGYITVEKLENTYRFLTDNKITREAAVEIMPSFWNWSPYYDKGSETIVNYDSLNDTRSTFTRVSLNRQDLIDVGLLDGEATFARIRGRKEIYDNAKCNAEFVGWFRVNTRAPRDRQIERLREIYEAAALIVGADEKGRAEWRTIRKLLSPVASGPNRPKLL